MEAVNIEPSLRRNVSESSQRMRGTKAEKMPDERGKV